MKKDALEDAVKRAAVVQEMLKVQKGTQDDVKRFTDETNGKLKQLEQEQQTEREKEKQDTEEKIRKLKRRQKETQATMDSVVQDLKDNKLNLSLTQAQAEQAAKEKEEEERGLKHKLPESVYTTALISVLIAKRPSSCYDIIAFLGVQFTSFLSFILCVAAQSFVIYYLWEDVETRLDPAFEGEDKIEPCSLRLRVPLQLIGAGAFVGIMLADLEESAMMLWWLMQKRSLYDQARQGRQSLADATLPQTESQLTIATDCITVEGGEDVQFHMSRCRRFWAAIFCVLPKLAITVCLTIVGTRFVVLAENESELLLNCVAMIFVIDFDDMAHKRLSPIRMKNLVKLLPEAVVVQHNQDGGRSAYHLLDNAVGAWAKFLFWAGTVEGLRLSAYLPFGCCWPYT